MDPKAAAKSKRSQSQQGKRSHPTPSAVAAHKKKEPLPQSKQPQRGGVPRSRRHLHNLPSNWDRYGGDDDTVFEVEEGVSGPVQGDATETAAKVTQPLAGGGDAVAPKSKGADFRYLIEQARSQPRDRGYGDGGLASTSLFDETVPDFVQGLISIISVKGESLLSWCSDDNFTVDNDAGSSFEVPFLSMDVHALGAQLSKLNTAQRLFIEEDILPTELHAYRLDENNVQRSDHVETKRSIESKHFLADDAFPGAENEQVERSQTKAFEGHDSMQMSGKEISLLLSQGLGIKQDQINSPESLEWENGRQSGDSGSKADMNSRIQDSAFKFEASAAETELDRLLDSFVVNNDFASPGSESGTFMTNNALDRLVHMGAVSSRQESSSSKTGAGVSLGDAVDEILAESHVSCFTGMCDDFSNSSGTQLKLCDLSTDVDARSSGPGLSDSRRMVPLEKSIDDLLAETSFGDSSGIDGQVDSGLARDRPHGSSVRLDAPYPMAENDSRNAASAFSLDETSDDLLAETSSVLRNQESSPHPQRKSHISYDKPTVSKALDDFDTWLDSI